MTDREYKLAVVEETWRNLAGRESPTRLLAYLREQDNDRAIDAVLWALGLDPTRLRNPLPDPTILDEMGGIA